LFFTAANNGVHNLYLADRDLKSAKPVSHVMTAVFSSAWDPLLKDIYVTTMTEKGPQVGRVDSQLWPKTASSELPVIQGMYADRYPAQKEAVVTPKPQAVESIEEYSSTTKLWPHYWIPWIFSSSVDNSVAVQVSTSGHDPLKKHNYGFTGIYETGVKRGSLLGSYQNNQSPWPILLQSSEINTYFYHPENLVTHTMASLSVWPEIWALNRYSLFEIGGKYQKTHYTDSLEATRYGTTARLIYSNYLKSGTQVSPESGQSLYAGGTHYYQNSDEVHHTQYIFGGSYYFSKFLPARHALMVKYNGFLVNEELHPVYGASTSPLMPLQDFSVPFYVMRGYATGQFFGRRMNNLNAEYRFPVMDLYRGRNTYAFFMHRLHGALTADGVSVDGYAYHRKEDRFERVGLDRQFWSYGLETRLETTVGYVLPINFVLGVYQVPDADYSPKTSVNFMLQGGTGF
jgi:hypothetical protein